jgi:phosphatidylserine/phosphatidylglycerophosphate/cardiolipin synthase-like enzyme
MKRLLATLVTAICGAALLGAYLVPTTAEAAPYTPRQGVVFNNAAGNKTSERRIQTVLDKAISAVPGCPRGKAGCQTITMAMYLFSQKSTADRLISAHKRGVNVHFLIDNGAWDASQIKRLRNAFGTSKARRSYVVKCNRGACMTDYPYATIHVKYYLFSQSGRAKKVSIISSANPHRVNIYNSFNNTHTITGAPKVYDRLMKYFSDMTKNRQNHSYGNRKNTASGPFTLYIYPQRPARINYLDVLRTVRCRTAKNMGSKGRTVVRMSMWGFTNPRMDVARKLWSLQNAGCKVDVTLNRGRASRTIMRQLTKTTKHGKMVVEDAWKDKNRNDYAEQYTHHKAMIINGYVQGRNQRVVWTGSQNLTSNGSLYNDDMVLRVAGSGYYFAYSKNFSYIQTKSKRLRSAPPPIVLKSHRSDDARLSPEAYVEARANAEDGG